jgi:hypothetical protein
LAVIGVPKLYAWINSGSENQPAKVWPALSGFGGLIVFAVSSGGACCAGTGLPPLELNVTVGIIVTHCANRVMLPVIAVVKANSLLKVPSSVNQPAKL